MAGSEHTDDALHSQLSTNPPPQRGKVAGGDFVAAGWWRVHRNKSVCVCLIINIITGALVLLCSVWLSAFSSVSPSSIRQTSPAFRVFPVNPLRYCFCLCLQLGSHHLTLPRRQHHAMNIHERGWHFPCFLFMPVTNAAESRAAACADDCGPCARASYLLKGPVLCR